MGKATEPIMIDSFFVPLMHGFPTCAAKEKKLRVLKLSHLVSSVQKQIQHCTESGLNRVRIVERQNCTEPSLYRDRISLCPCYSSAVKTVKWWLEALRSQTIHFLKDSNSGNTERQADECHVDCLPPINSGCKENLSLMNELISEFKIYLVIYNIVIKVSMFI